MSYPNWIYSAFAFIGFLLAAIPAPWHLEAWNTGTCLYIMWTGLGCLFYFVNSIVWSGNVIDHAPVWCDITTKFYVGAGVGIPMASLCINRRLYLIATSNAVTITKAEKRRSVMIDLAIGLGVPILEMILHVIPQGHRYNIIEDVGCYPSTYTTPVAFALVYCWPIVIGLISSVYCGLSIIAFNKRRAQFQQLLSSNSNLNSNRFFRLMALAGTEILLTVPLGSFALWLNVKGGVSPWLGWADTHYNFNRADLFPSLLWRDGSYSELSLELSRWMMVFCSIVFFCFFGFADEARKHYRSYMTIVAKSAGLSVGGTTSSGTLNSSSGGGFSSKWKFGSSASRGTLPVFVNKETYSKRDSFESFTSGQLNDKSLGQLSLGNLGEVAAMPASPISSGSSDRSSIISDSKPGPDDDDDDIEISSIRRVSKMDRNLKLNGPRLPEPVCVLEPPKHAVDTPFPV